MTPISQHSLNEHALRRLLHDRVDDELWHGCGQALAGRPELFMPMPELALRLGVPSWPRRRSEPLGEYLHRRHADILRLRGVGSSRRLLVNWCVARLLDPTIELPVSRTSTNPAQEALATHIDQLLALLETSDQAQVFATRVGALCRALIELASTAVPSATARDVDLVSRRLSEARQGEASLVVLADGLDVGRERVRQILGRHGDAVVALRPGWSAGGARAHEAAIRAGANRSVVDRLARVAIFLGNDARTLASSRLAPSRPPQPDGQAAVRSGTRRTRPSRTAVASMR